jgi:hypothetical protein
MSPFRLESLKYSRASPMVLMSCLREWFSSVAEERLSMLPIDRARPPCSLASPQIRMSIRQSGTRPCRSLGSLRACIRRRTTSRSCASSTFWLTMTSRMLWGWRKRRNLGSQTTKGRKEPENVSCTLRICTRELTPQQAHINLSKNARHT